MITGPVQSGVFLTQFLARLLKVKPIFGLRIYVAHNLKNFQIPIDIVKATVMVAASSVWHFLY
jgi:hypothetical protein